MVDYYKNRKYFVYRHVAPNGKMYIGITSKSRPEDRWGYGGSGYSENAHFWAAIKKYGWNNFKHIVVVHGVDVDTACRLEEYLIGKYDSMNNGYNQTSGGVHPTEVTDDIRVKISVAVKNHRASLPAGVWSSKFIGHEISASTRKKLSAKAQGRKYPQEVIDRRVATFKANMTDERRKVWSDSSKGRRVSAATRLKLSEINKGKSLSAETRANLSQKAIQRYKEINYIWVHHNSIEHIIDCLDLYDYLDQGYELGRSNIELVYITKNNINKKVPHCELEHYISEGWKQGFNESRISNICKSKYKFIYTYGDLEFNTGEEVASYLRNNGYPKIVQGTVNNICQGKTILAYPELSGKIVRRKIDENR